MRKRLKSGVFLALNLLLFFVVFMVTTGSYTSMTGSVIDYGCWQNPRYNYELDIYSGFWSSEEDFHKNSSGDEISITVDEYAGEENFIKYADRRNADGWSNWNKPSFEVKYLGSNKWDVEDIELNTPPTALHLVLNSFDQQHSGEIPSKKWKVTSVSALAASDAFTEEEWEHYKDNTYTFGKDGKVIIDLGTLKSKDETDLFKNTQIANATYNVYSAKDVDKLPATTDLGSQFVRTLASADVKFLPTTFIMQISIVGGKAAEFTYSFSSFGTIVLAGAFQRGDKKTYGSGMITIEPVE